MKDFDHVFPSTDIRVTYTKIPSTLVNDARLALLKQKPSVPVTTIQEEGPLFGKTEERPEDPDYQRILQRWLRSVQNRLMELQIDRSIVTIHVDNWEKQAEDLRSFLVGLGSDELPDSDVTLFITRIAAGTDECLTEFAQLLQRRSLPTPEVVEEIKQTFPADVRRPGRVQR